MPCPHMEINIVKRAEGQSAVNAAAYQTGEKLYSERDRKYMYNGTKEELIMKEILLPPHAPPEFADRKTLWNSVEAAEKNWNSQLARRMKITLPKELSMEDNIALAKEYCQKEFVSKGMIADLAIHDPDPPNHNPHFHVLLTIRPLDENGKWAPKAHKPFFTLKLTHTQDSSVLYQQTFSFYEIEKAPTAATTSGGVMDGSTKSKVVFTTSVTDATYKATFTLGSHSGSATSTTKTLEYAIPLAWCSEIPNKTTGTANIACQVLFGGQVYRTFNTTITVSVPSSIVPTVTAFTLADKSDTPVPSSWNLFVQHQSGAKLSAITCAGAQGSTISTVRLQVGTQSTSKTYSASDLPQIDTITQSGSLTVTVTVTDSRGRTGYKTGTVTFTPYSAPKFTRCVSERCDSSGELDNDGTYFRSTTTVEYSSCGGNNAVTMTMKYKKTDAVVYNPEVTLVPGVNICGEGNLDTEFSYDVVYIVSDQFRSVSFMDYVSTAIYLMHFLHGGKGLPLARKQRLRTVWTSIFRLFFGNLFPS